MSTDTSAPSDLQDIWPGHAAINPTGATLARDMLVELEGVDSPDSDEDGPATAERSMARAPVPQRSRRICSLGASGRPRGPGRLLCCALGLRLDRVPRVHCKHRQVRSPLRAGAGGRIANAVTAAGSLPESAAYLRAAPFG